MIGGPPTSTTSDQRSKYFGLSSSTQNDKATFQAVNAALCIGQKTICKCSEIIGHKYNACIIRDPNFLPPSIRINVNQLNTLHGNEPTYLPRYWNIQTPLVHFKYWNSPPQTSSVILSIMGRLTSHVINNGDI